MIGQTVSQYKILEKLGEGGMGVVYKAEDTKLDRDVALKFLSADLTASQENVTRFEIEARAISALNHPHIATIYNIGEENGQKYLVLEYIPGGTLKAKLKQLKSENKEFSVNDVVNYGIQMAEALAHAHRRQIIHRDVKTDNMMLTEEGKVKLTDFGLAKLHTSMQITKTGTTMGTLAYMAPEQICGEDVDHRADLFSLGVVLYELIASELPFRGDHEAALIYSITSEDPVPLESIRQNLPKELGQMIEKCLKKNKSQRYQSADELVSDLRDVRRALSGNVRVVFNQPKILWLIAIVFIVILAIGVYLIVPGVRHTTANKKTIAVLPFLNLSDSKEDEYFSEGITDDILTLLYKIGDLRVISRTTMRQYKETDKSVSQIGNELNAGTVLEGSVRRVGNRIRIVAQLIDAGNDDHLWAEIYDREMKDVFDVQSEIAQNIANALQAQLSSVERNRLVVRPTPNLEAYNLMLEGVYYFARGGRDDVLNAIEKFNRAIAIDSGNARAWAHLATAYARQADVGALSTDAGYTMARQAAEKSLSLDEQLAQGHTIMGWIKRSYDWDWVGAEVECRIALEIAPGDITVIRNMANMDKSLGRFDEAITLIKKAITLDPNRVPIYTSLGFFSMYANQLGDAAEAYKKAIELNPKYPAAHTFLGLVYCLQEKPDTALAEIRLESDEGWRLYGLAQAYYSSERYTEADTVLNELIAKYGGESAYQVAQAYAFQGKTDKALKWLEKAYISRDGGLSELKGDPFMKKIESDHRYIEFVKKMKLPI